MADNFFEIDNVAFFAGGKNKVNNISLKIENCSFFSFLGFFLIFRFFEDFFV